ncbi:hypothetical protein [Alienimonas californiensis]|uniref:Uncharacterized protein n=1 Tax=Alienimonas californiensis TaxID=2527989 RepID=A0A517PD16_9PLAN|nr:hypothetical protein [Alienimonas californiensis]QDT17262.1 hypothetical protein CA12_33760 [Alienimonas californiensis]
MPGVEVWLLAVPVAGLLLHRASARRVVCPSCGGRRCSSAAVVHLVAGSQGARTTSHRRSACGCDFVLIGGDPARPHIAATRLPANR